MNTVDIDFYSFPFSKCHCGCGGAMDSTGNPIVWTNWRSGDPVPTFEEVMAAVAGGGVPGDEIVRDVGCKCGSWATYGKGGAGHADYCPEYVQ